MQFLESNELESWCREHGIALDADDKLVPDPALKHKQSIQYARGKQSGREWAVAALCVQALGQWDHCLIWVREWGIWPSSEDWPAYYALRGAQGERRSLGKAPGHLFARTEDALLATFLTSVMQSAWDADLIVTLGGSPAPVRAFISNDEFVDFHSAVPMAIRSVAV